MLPSDNLYSNSPQLEVGVALLLTLSMINESAALSPFQLTYLPAHVVNHMSKHVTVRCAHEDDNEQSQLQDVSRIRMLKKTSSDDWQLLAELRDNEDSPTTYINVSVTAKISSNIRESFMEIVWPVATLATFGTYRCDVIGFDKKTFLVTSEVTSEVSLLEESVTASDMLGMFIETKDELQQLDDRERSLEEDFEGLDKELSNVGDQVQHQAVDVSRLEHDMNEIHQALTNVRQYAALLKEDISSLKSEVNSAQNLATVVDNLNTDLQYVKTEVSSLGGNPSRSTSTVASGFSVLMSWPAGRFALLQPKTGCPVDLTFFGGSDKYWQIHTQSSPVHSNMDKYSDVLSPNTITSNKGNNFLTLRFCEANGILNTGAWPLGSYCVNGLVDVQCPAGFEQGEVNLDGEDLYPVTEYTSRSVYNSGENVTFCCMKSGDVSSPMTLPTLSSFLLYRHGGQCQEVAGMGVTEESFDVTIEAEKDINNQVLSGKTPDVDLIWNGALVRSFYLCYYTPV